MRLSMTNMTALQLASIPKICKNCKFCEPAKDWSPTRNRWMLWVPVLGWIIYGISRLIDREYEGHDYLFAKCAKEYHDMPEIVDLVSGKKHKPQGYKSY